MNKSETVARGNMQPHSAGELYPWTVLVVFDEHKHRGYCQAMNGEDGRTLHKWHFNRFDQSGFDSFGRAHGCAESECQAYVKTEACFPPQS